MKRDVVDTDTEEGFVEAFPDWAYKVDHILAIGAIGDPTALFWLAAKLKHRSGMKEFALPYDLDNRYDTLMFIDMLKRKRIKVMYGSGFFDVYAFSVWERDADRVRKLAQMFFEFDS